jgi:hypothetical protein
MCFLVLKNNNCKLKIRCMLNDIFLDIDLMIYWIDLNQLLLTYKICDLDDEIVIISLVNQNKLWSPNLNLPNINKWNEKNKFNSIKGPKRATGRLNLLGPWMRSWEKNNFIEIKLKTIIKLNSQTNIMLMSEIEKKKIKKKQLKLIWINLKKIMKFNFLIIQYLRIK